MPHPYGGTYRQIQVYVDPLKLEAHQLTLMDVVNAVNQSNLILPAGDVRIGNKDYNIYANASSQRSRKSIVAAEIGDGAGGASWSLVGDVGKAVDAGAIQTNIVRIDGQRSVYVPVFKQGGDSNTITIVSGVKNAVKHLVDIPSSPQDRRRFRSVAVRQVGPEERRERGWHRTGPHRTDDPALPRQPARHRSPCCSSFRSRPSPVC